MKQSKNGFVEKGREKLFSIFNGKEAARAWDIGMILVLGLSISVLLTLFYDRLPRQIDLGAVATQDIKADQDYEIIDEKSTAKLKDDEESQVLDIYDFDPSIEADTAAHIHEAFEGGRAFLDEKKGQMDRGGNLSPVLEEQAKTDFFKKLEVNLIDDQYEIIRKFRFHPAIERAVTTLLHSAMASPIVPDVSDLEVLREKGFVLRHLAGNEELPEEMVGDISQVQDLETVRKKISDFSFKSLEGSLNLEFMGGESLNVLKEAVLSFIKINTNRNNLETDERRGKARDNVKNIIIKVQAGESIIRSGDRFEPWDVTVISGILKEKMKTNRYLKFLGVFLFVNLFLIVIYYFAAKYIRKFHPNRKDLVFLGLNLIFFLMILRFGAFLGGLLRDALPFSVQTQTLNYAIPIAGGAMLIRFILNSETAFVYAVILSLFSGIYLDNSLEMMVYYLISGVFASHVIAHADQRSRVLMCGFQTGIVSALTIFSLNLISTISISAGQFTTNAILLNMCAGFLGGIFTSMVVLGLSPMMEALFKYTTDIQLLEMANLSHPLLKEMIVRAPGTYHHSQIVGILSEAAAQAIGANPLLSRVGSYYHDIGKMKKPQYFIENQRGGDNPHDALAPSMSALIIAAHVKDGLEMAREYKLPQIIADFIPEHQGTKLIGYFFNKAKKMVGPNDPKVDERNFRYEGPKPQTREAGIIMLADTGEAAVRSMPEKSPSKIQSTVEKLVNAHFVDGQLDECDITLKDLHLIIEAFVRILVAMYHQRVEYPEEKFKTLIQVVKDHDDEKDSDHKRSSSLDNISPLFKK